MSSNGDPPNVWPQHVSREDDQQWTRQYVNGVWPHAEADPRSYRSRASERIDAMRRNFSDNVRLTHRADEIMHRMLQECESLIVENERLQSVAHHAREREENMRRQLTSIASSSPPAPIPLVVGRVENIRFMTAEQQDEFNRIPIHSIDWGRSRLQDEMRAAMIGNHDAVIRAMGVPSHFLAEKVKMGSPLEEKKLDITGRIIDLES